MSDYEYLLLIPDEDGNPLRFLTADSLQALLDNPKETYGVTAFRTLDDVVHTDPAYWPTGVGVLLKVESVVPVVAGSYRLPS